MVTSPALKLITAPEARKRSDHMREVVPRAAPSLVVGDAVSEKVIAEDPESTTISPVVDPPMVKVCILVVLITPAASKVRSPEIVAVGVPPAIFMKAIFAEDVAVPPIKISSV